VSACDDGQREDDSPRRPRDLPRRRYNGRREHDHHGDDRETYAERESEALPDTRDLNPEVGPLDLLYSGSPSHVV